jgi:hypothetical protein
LPVECVYERRSKNRPQCSAYAAHCGLVLLRP